MIFRIIGALALGLVLTGCSGGLNPMNWFGPKVADDTVTVEPADGWPSELDDYRGPVGQVTRVTVERASAGYIIRAVGVPARQGYWEAELVPENDEEPVNGVMSYKFMVAPPPWATSTARPYARQITVAKYVSDITLGETRRIKVIGETNSVTAARR